MKKHIAATFVAVAALTAAHPYEGIALDAAAKAAAVLAEARKHLGGEEKLRAVKTLQASGDWRRSMGDMEMEGELELLLELPDRLRRNESIGMPGGATMVRTEILNGMDTWDDSSQHGGMGGGHMMMLRGPGGREMSAEEMKEMRRRMRRAELARHLLAWLLATDASVAHVGVAEASDGTADVLEATSADGPPVRLFVDQATHLPLMLTWRGPSPRTIVRRMGAGIPPPPDDVAHHSAGATAPPQATLEMRFQDYRPVDGIKLPHLITRSVNGSTTEEWTIKTYKLNASFKRDTFTK